MNQSLVYATSPQGGYDSIKKYGGTMIHVKGKWTTRFPQVLPDMSLPQSGKGKDPMGRWCWVTIRGNKDRKITYISAYRVNGTTADRAGSETIWQQEYNCHLQHGKLIPILANYFLKISLSLYKFCVNSNIVVSS